MIRSVSHSESETSAAATERNEGSSSSKKADKANQKRQNEAKAQEKTKKAYEGRPEFGHQNKHQPPTEINGKRVPYDDSEQATKVLAKNLPPRHAAMYNTRDPNKVQEWEGEARQHGLQLYAARNTDPGAITTIHKFPHTIGVDQNEATSTMRLDGDHGHPIQEENRAQNTSFGSYFKNSVNNAKKVKGDSTQKIKDIKQRKNGASGEELAQHEKHLKEANADRQHADDWLNTAHSYATQKGLNPTDYGFWASNSQEGKGKRKA